jgi:hypothetical protein
MRRFPKLAADPGRVLRSPDNSVGEVKLALFRAPEDFAARATILLAASSVGPGWKPQTLEISQGARQQFVRTGASKSILGETRSPIRAAQTAVEVDLYDAGQWLVNCSEEDLAVGENMAFLGNEVIQFGRAMSLGGGRFRLSGLLRARKGTQLADHPGGEAFALIVPGTLQAIPVRLWSDAHPVKACTRDGGAKYTLAAAKV